MKKLDDGISNAKGMYFLIYLNCFLCNHTFMEDGSVVNNYKIIRKIASGGVGIVYLAEALDSKKLFALKLIASKNASHEKASFEKYSSLSGKAGLMQILDKGDFEDFFYYLMPLADSLNEYMPTDLRYVPKTLANIIEYKSETSTSWFSPEEIKSFMLPVFEGLEILESQGLLHRDIKPENILFIDNKAILCDFGLLTLDTRDVSNIGTPFFLAPTWYTNSKGNPDIWGIASCFYMLITGNYPDSIGRYAYTLPECYKALDDFPLKAQYAHWHRCILRACSENAKDRFFSLGDFKSALFSNDFNVSKNYNKAKARKFSVAKLGYSLIAVFLCLIASFFILYEAPKEVVEEVLSPEGQEDKENLKRLEAMDPIWTKTYKYGNTVENTPLSEAESIALYGYWRGKPKKGEEYIELKSYRDWLVDFAKQKEIYLNHLEKLKDKNLSVDEQSKLNIAIYFETNVYHLNLEPNLELYIKHIDITLHPEKYSF